MATGIDAIYPASIGPLPFYPDYVFGYIDGQWPSFAQMKAKYPLARAVSISANPDSVNALSAVVADCEEGDYSEEDAADASAKKLAAGWVPAIYCSFAIWHDCMETCVQEGVDPNEIDWLIAAYPGIGPTLYPGSPGHQFVDQGSYDQWVIQDGWQPGRPIVTPKPKVSEEMIASTPSGNGYWVCKPDGSIWSYGDAQYLYGLNHPKQLLVAGDTVTGFASHPTSQGYWISTASGAVYAFGAAAYHGGPNVP